jgi:hypothetical protein
MLGRELREALLLPSAALHGLGSARSGRDSRFADRTGKLDLWGRRPDDRATHRIEGDDANRCPVAGRFIPSIVAGLRCRASR